MEVGKLVTGVRVCHRFCERQIFCGENADDEEGGPWTSSDTNVVSTSHHSDCPWRRCRRALCDAPAGEQLAEGQLALRVATYVDEWPEQQRLRHSAASAVVEHVVAPTAGHGR